MDTPLNDLVVNALQNNPHVTPRRLYCLENDGRVVLRGKVGSYFEKQMAQESLRNLDGVSEVSNELEVTWQ